MGSDGHEKIGIVEAARVGDKIAVFALSGRFCHMVLEASSQQEVPKVATLKDERCTMQSLDSTLDAKPEELSPEPVQARLLQCKDKAKEEHVYPSLP